MLSVIPERPANLSVVNRTFDSALLHWTVPFPMQHFPPGLYHRIMYQNQWDRSSEKLAGELKKRQRNFITPRGC